VPINSVENADLAQTPVLAEPQQPSATSRNNDGLEMLETREWLDSLDYVLSRGGPERAGRLLQQLSLHARRAAGVNLPFTATTPYQKDRKSTRLNSSHVAISYAVFCLKKKTSLLILAPITTRPSTLF